MNIAKLQLNFQPTTPHEVWEQHGVTIKEGMATLDSRVTDYATLFDQAMELLTNPQEDPNLETLDMKVRQMLQKYDEVKVIVCTLAPTHRLTKLQEGKQLQAQVEEVRREKPF